MRKIAFLMAALLGAMGGAVAEMVRVDLQNHPGVVLQHNHKYVVNSDLPITARGPGQSALRVLPGTMAAIEIASGATLTVTGGDAFGALPAGAGIEVPYGAKLVICGPNDDNDRGGTLKAYGGKAANGGDGYGGSAGLESLMQAPLSYKPGTSPYPAGMTNDIVNHGVALSEFCKTPLPLLFVGSGGNGGDGGGGDGRPQRRPDRERGRLA